MKKLIERLAGKRGASGVAGEGENQSSLTPLILVPIFFSCSIFLLCFVSMAGCGQSVPEDKTKNFSLADYLCILAPSECHGDLYKKVYLAPPDAIYEITLNGKNLKVPMGYLNTTQLLKDPRYPVKKELFMEALLPDLAPHGPQNLREFFTPYEQSRISILVMIRSSGAMVWDDAVNRSAELSSSGAISLTRRPDKFGLAGWGEDYTKWPSHKPCGNLGKDEPPCGKPPMPMGDVWRPIKPNGTTSIMVCEPDILDDIDAKVLAMPTAAREAYFADPKQWWGRRRAFCSHEMFYEPLNAMVALRYPRRFIAQWKETEDRVRVLLDSFVEHGAQGK